MKNINKMVLREFILISNRNWFLCGLFTCFDLHGSTVRAALSFAVSHGQLEPVLPLHQVSQEQHRLVVRVVQDLLKPTRDKRDFRSELNSEGVGSVRAKEGLTPAAGLLSSRVHRYDKPPSSSVECDPSREAVRTGREIGGLEMTRATGGWSFSGRGA